MIWVGFKILTRTPVPKIPELSPPTITEDIKGYISSKNSIWIGQCSVKSSIRIGWVFSKAGYMIGLGFKILTRTPVPKIPELPLPPTITEDIKGYISSKNTI